MVRKIIHSSKFKFLTIFFILLSGVAILQIGSISAMALSNVVGKDPVQITGKSNSSIYPDITVNDLMNVVAWGEPEGFGMQELTDAQLAQVYGAGFSSFTLDTTNGIALMNFPGITVSTFTEINSLKMGYYDIGGVNAWDNNWTGQGAGNVLLGTSNNDLVFNGLYIEAQFTNITNNNERQLDYLHIGTRNLTGLVTANFQSFSGDIAGNSYTRNNLGNAIINAVNSEFYLSLSRTGGIRFYWGAGTTKTP